MFSEANLALNSNAVPKLKLRIWSALASSSHPWNITVKLSDNLKHCDKTKQRAESRSEARNNKNNKKDHDEPDYRHS